jgi:hypothetical protein
MTLTLAGVGTILVSRNPASKYRAELCLRPLPTAGRDEHVHIVGCAPAALERSVDPRRVDALDEEELTVRGHRAAAVREDRGRALIVPIVDDVLRNVRVGACRDLAKEVAGRRPGIARRGGQGDPAPSQVEKGEAEVRRFGGVLNASLAGRRFLCGDRLTVADFAVGAWLNYAQPAGYPIHDFRARSIRGLRG